MPFMGFIVTCQGPAEEGDTAKPHHRRDGTKPPSTLHPRSTRGGGRVLTGSSYTSRPRPPSPLLLCTHNPWRISHTLQGSTSSSLQIKSGATSLMASPCVCPHQKGGGQGGMLGAWSHARLDSASVVCRLHAGLPRETSVQ